MAKKKDTAEEDWFDEDSDEQEDKESKKKGKKKGRKKGKVIAWIVAFVVILAILLFIRFKYTEPAAEENKTVEVETAPPAEVETQYVEEPEETGDDETGDSSGETYSESKYLGADVVDKEDLPKVVEVIDTSVAPELFSNLKCDYDYESNLLYISLRIYNTLDEEIKISPRGVTKGYNTYFLIRGVVDTDPGCNTELLQPKEWTDCNRIGFDLARYANVPGINRISVQVPGKTEALLIDCPEPPASADDEE
jgi:hypothetical protein